MASLGIFQKIEEILERITKTIDEVDEPEKKSVAKIQQTGSFSVPRESRYNQSYTKNAVQQANHSLTSSKQNITKEFECFRPKLSKKSIILAKKLGPSYKRLLETPEKKKVPEETLTFTPEINKKSQKIMKKYPKLQSCWEELYEENFHKQIKLNITRKLNQKNDLSYKECTFKPNLLPNSHEKSAEDFLTRCNNWVKAKKEKISLKYEADLYKTLEKCTFTPEIHEFHQENFENIEEIRGVPEFLHRQSSSKSNSLKKPSKVPPKSRSLTLQQYEKAISELNSYLHS